MKKLLLLPLLLLAIACNKQQDNPNILIILADDLGYGDVSSYGQNTLLTPEIDRLAENGLRFTDGHCSSATCTPSRYALLTGQYPWRNERARILQGNAPLIIDPGRPTIASMLRDQGYATAVIGKWHLGLGDGNVDWNKRVSPGPAEVGFDYSYILAATQDRTPTVLLRNQLVDGLDPDDPLFISYKENFEGEPTGKENPEMLKMHPSHGHDQSITNGISRIGYQKGGKAAMWIDEDLADKFTEDAVNWIHDNMGQPFFLFFPLHQPHVPRTPHERFVGKSGLGPRGDVIKEADWSVGVLLNTLEELGLSDNTLVIFSSDNGPVLDDGYHDDAVVKIGDHDVNGPLRGGKYSLLDAGTRVPFFVHWPGKIKQGVSDALVSQVDIFATIADILDLEVPLEAEDSKIMTPAFFGKSKTGRNELFMEAGGRVAMQKDGWYFIPPYKGPAVSVWVNIETGRSTDFQLYRKTDIGQEKNIADDYPELIEQFKTHYEEKSGLKINIFD